jgi:hypothetical protein
MEKDLDTVEIITTRKIDTAFIDIETRSLN